MNTNSPIKLNSSYINACARSLRSDVRKACRKQGFVPDFGKQDFVFVINGSGQPIVQVWYKLNGIDQCSNMAI